MEKNSPQTEGNLNNNTDSRLGWQPNSGKFNGVFSGNVNGANFYFQSGDGYYWSSSVNDGDYAYFLYFGSSDVYPADSGYYRSNGLAVRCVFAGA
jgi:uncharacterized protein (TIGR02145 family)